ncbi:MAG TPA: class I SAM-dependent methyltransferase [Gemmataceae bacterium]|nr:class I SAM-dependent methyltransferase [Gemmataceae bacterium]
MNAFAYVGDELDVFAHAVNWKRYFGRLLAPYVRGEVLEVGAGIGGTTRVLCTPRADRWVCLEPDPELAERLRMTASERPFAVPVDVEVGTVASLADDRRFDCILYIDVLEHIEADRAELEAAAKHLKPGGTLIVLCPAHPMLYTEFDRAIGHYRRYTKAMYRAIEPDGLRRERLIYLDSAGLLLSLGNRLLLRSGSPTLKQVKVWDRLFVPISRLMDPLLGRTVGKSIVGVWRNAA